MKLAITNSYGNFDMVHCNLPARYSFVSGKRLQPIARKLKIRFVPAVTGFEINKYKDYPARPIIGGIIVHRSRTEKILTAIKLRESPEAIAKREAAAKKRAAKTLILAEARQVERQQKANRLGYRLGSSLESAYQRGELSEDQIELKAFKSHYRHNFTDYDQQYERQDFDSMKECYGYHDAIQMMREEAYESKIEQPIPDIWDEYLKKYNFNSPEAKAMASVLKSPKNAHPVWFKEREIGLRGRDLSSLNYEVIRDAKLD